MADAQRASRAAGRAHVYLAHGASGNAASMAPHVEGLHRRGLDATAVELPKRRAEEAIGVYRGQLHGGDPLVIGGHSYGGRVASLLAADVDGVGPTEPPLGGLVLLSYPLHRPGQPTLEGRVDHWPRIACPVLLLSGDADQFARIDLLREAVRRLPDGQLLVYPRQRHGLLAVLDDVLDHVARFVEAV